MPLLVCQYEIGHKIPTLLADIAFCASLVRFFAFALGLTY